MGWSYFAFLGVLLAVGVTIIGTLALAGRRQEKASLSPDERAGLAQTLDPTDAVAGGWADAHLATDHPTGLAILDEPAVAVAQERIASMREVFSLLAATRERPLVLAAPDFHEEVVESFAVTAARGLRQVLLVTCPDPEATAVAVDAQVLRRIDLTSGIDPTPRLGRCERWVASREHSWVNPQV